MLEQAVGEAAGGGAHVEADRPRASIPNAASACGELVAAPAHEARRRRHLDAAVRRDQRPRLVRAPPVHADAAGQDHARRLLAARREPARDEGRVEPRLRRAGRVTVVLGPRSASVAHAGSRRQPVMRSRNSSARVRARSRSSASATTWKQRAIGVGDGGHPFVIPAHAHALHQLHVLALGRLHEPAHHRALPLVGTRHLRAHQWLSGTARVSWCRRTSSRAIISRMRTTAAMPSKAGWKRGKMRPPCSSPTRTTSSPSAASVSARGVPRERVIAEAVLVGEPLEGPRGGDGHHDASRAAGCASRAGRRGPGSGRRAGSPPSRRPGRPSPPRCRGGRPRSASRVRTMFESWPSERWNSSARLGDAALVEIGVERDHVDAERAQHRREDGRRRAEGVVEHHAQAGPADRPRGPPT